MSNKESIEIVKKFNQENRYRDCGKINNAIDEAIELAEKYLKMEQNEKDRNIELATTIDALMTDLKEQKQLNEVHQKINGELRIKIKELENADLTVVYLDGVYDGKKKWKDKIKEKIKDLKENDNGDDYSLINVINILKELLGE